jgi:hypothetical protein
MYLLMWQAGFLSVVAWHYVYVMKEDVSLASVKWYVGVVYGKLD